MVVNGIFQSDTTWRIHVSSSKSVIDSSSFNNVVNASVLIEDDNGNIIDVLAHDTNGFYIGNTIPQANFTYNLSIIHPTLDDITSRNEVPSIINLIGIDTATSYSNGEKYLDLTVNFEDPGNASNYYLVETYVIGLGLEIENGDTLESEIDTSRAFMLLNDEVFQDGGSPWKDQGLFNDLLFNGQTKSLEISIPNNDWNWGEAGFVYSYRYIGLRFYLYNISQDYYYYRRSLELYNQTNGNPFAQPVQVFSNIQNGFGIFAGAQVNYFDFDL
tara:strand:- start:1564 stop:2379 length:816 start_codon:yes stop_codon:yes gene_type:complete